MTIVARQAMLIIINGKREIIDPGVTVAQLLARRNLQPIRVAVELNEDLIPRGELGDTIVREGDRLEIVTLVGGG